ncbi:MAG: hypothetical protein QIT35_gp40 [Methanophagales virus PBV299]|uniref:Uncharacterized protein n=1 Tax=Methanophagales virus PBV299 TaxID=2987730 RepID=A0ABY6GLF5_9CAUD|nr:MAG: hypothetical protein QIT35_gp40 [Methanophagales virus PBV299]UYL64836.1 MAG: hypothetical protein OFDIEDLO_00040 [Methanophagales virus PBV299]
MSSDNLSWMIGKKGLYIEVEDARFVQIGPQQTLPEVYENITRVSWHITKDILMGFQPWIVSGWELPRSAIGVGRYISFVWGPGQAFGRNIYLDWDGNLWIPEYSDNHITILQLQGRTPYDCDDPYHPPYIRLNVSYIDSGRACLGPREGDYVYVLTTNANGSEFSQAIWRVPVPPANSTDRELVATFSHMARPYDIIWDGHNEVFVVPSYEEFEDYGYFVYTVDVNGDWQDIHNTSHPLQQIARAKDGYYWINCRGENKIMIIDPALDNVSWTDGFPLLLNAEIRGIGENIWGDIVVANKEGGSAHTLFFLADDDYRNKRILYIGHKTYKAAPAGEGVILTSVDTHRITLVYPQYGTFLDFDLDSTGTPPITPYGQGDVGLMRWKIWNWNWSPDVSAIYKWVLGYEPENIS